MQLGRFLRYSGLALILLVFAVGPFFRGLFFWTELLAGIALVGLGFAVWLVGRRLVGEPVALSGGVPGLALVVLLGCYVAQFPTAVYARGNLDWVLRVAAAWCVYVMLRAEAGPRLRRGLAWLLVLTAAGMAIHGFMEFTGYLAINTEMAEALTTVNLGQRMYTPLQYPNTGAVYFLAALLVSTGLILEDLRPWKLVVLTSLNTLLTLAFFFTVSRGAIVVLPFGLALFFLGIDTTRRWPGFLSFIAAAVPVLAVAKQVGDLATAHTYSTAFGWIAGAVAAGALAGFTLSRVLRLRIRLQATVVGLAILLAAVGLIALKPSGELLPKQAARLLDMNLRTQNVVYRLVLNQDALKMVADRPLGMGGWGWERSYRRYQEVYYVGRETHNHYLQTAVEAGVPGLAALAVGMGAAMWVAWCNRRVGPAAWALASGAGLIAGHSIIDFDLSYGLVWLLFWAMLAVASEPLPVNSWRRPALAGTMAGACAVVVAGGVLGLASWYTDQAEGLVEQGKRSEATAAAQAGARLDPLSSAPLLLLGDRPSLERAVRLDPYQTKPRWELAVVLQNQGDWEGALEAARATVENHPLVSIHYSKLATIAGSIMVDALHNANTARASELARELVGLGEAFVQRQQIPETRRGPWMGPRMSMAPDFKLRYGQALYLVGRSTEAEPLLKEASTVGLLGSEAELWLYVLYERRGDTRALDSLASKPWIRFRNANPVYKALHGWKDI